MWENPIGMHCESHWCKPSAESSTLCYWPIIWQRPTDIQSMLLYPYAIPIALCRWIRKELGQSSVSLWQGIGQHSSNWTCFTPTSTACPIRSIGQALGLLWMKFDIASVDVILIKFQPVMRLRCVFCDVAILHSVHSNAFFHNVVHWRTA